ncbi:MAG: pyridoxamine 5'-phosphate oxidase family protein [Dehalococcoidales bacterium]|nr:pyridoxamine 5'-phosphate oxidase family protein [Dehalococcoidales bacterium]
MGNFEELSDLIKRVLASQRFAVLATQSEGQPYGNLVAFAEADNLRSLLFVTGRNTRKYSNILVNKESALVIDSRTNQALDLNNAIAITALGTIEEANTLNKEHLSGIYLSKHPELRDFLYKKSNALMKVSVTDYVVATFGSVRHFSVRQLV